MGNINNIVKKICFMEDDRKVIRYDYGLDIIV